jgi:predicted  nucleic acid-binding Zn-ribbon protein
MKSHYLRNWRVKKKKQFILNNIMTKKDQNNIAKLLIEMYDGDKDEEEVRRNAWATQRKLSKMVEEVEQYLDSKKYTANKIYDMVSSDNLNLEELNNFTENAFFEIDELLELFKNHELKHFLDEAISSVDSMMNKNPLMMKLES